MKSQFKEYYDISVFISTDLPIYPGDTIIEINSLYSMEKGDKANILEFKLGSHTGTHVDAPLHFLKDGTPLDQIKLEKFCGPSKVFELPVKEKIRRVDIQTLTIARNDIVLFKTKNSDLWDFSEFQENYIYLTPEAAQFLVEMNIKAVGIDYLSIEKYRSKEHLTHRKLLENGILILEGINLKNIQPGEYFLFFFPLKLTGADGSPVRAVLCR